MQFDAFIQKVQAKYNIHRKISKNEVSIPKQYKYAYAIGIKL